MKLAWNPSISNYVSGSPMGEMCSLFDQQGKKCSLVGVTTMRTGWTACPAEIKVCTQTFPSTSLFRDIIDAAADSPLRATQSAFLLANRPFWKDRGASRRDSTEQGRVADSIMSQNPSVRITAARQKHHKGIKARPSTTHGLGFAIGVAIGTMLESKPLRKLRYDADVSVG
ncbi:hypothetical protein Q7P37_000096 [Cladosporium fusiforme]